VWGLVLGFPPPEPKKSFVSAIAGTSGVTSPPSFRDFTVLFPSSLFPDVPFSPALPYLPVLLGSPLRFYFLAPPPPLFFLSVLVSAPVLFSLNLSFSPSDCPGSTFPLPNVSHLDRRSGLLFRVVYRPLTPLFLPFRLRSPLYLFSKLSCFLFHFFHSFSTYYSPFSPDVFPLSLSENAANLRMSFASPPTRRPGEPPPKFLPLLPPFP